MVKHRKVKQYRSKFLILMENVKRLKSFFGSYDNPILFVFNRCYFSHVVFLIFSLFHWAEDTVPEAFLCLSLNKMLRFATFLLLHLWGLCCVSHYVVITWQQNYWYCGWCWCTWMLTRSGSIHVSSPFMLLQALCKVK